MNKLLSLKLSNFRSFFSEQTINFENKIDSNVTAFYGPNGSGKSNTAKALQFIKRFVKGSASAEITDIPSEPFSLLATNSVPISFEIEFINDDRKFRYGFSFFSGEIVGEKLVSLNSQKEKVIFNRCGQKIVNASTAKQFGFTEGLLSKTRKTTLLITKAREDNNSYANEVFEFLDSLNVITCGTSGLRSNVINLLKKDPAMENKVLSFLQKADLWIRGITIEDLDIPEAILKDPDIPDKVKKQIIENGIVTVNTMHSVRDTAGKIVGLTPFSLNSQESRGTNVVFDLAVLIIEAIEQGSILYIDEFGIHLHSDICQYILALFRKHPKTQLILNTHDILLMDDLRREEIIFINKRQNEESVVIPFTNLSPRESEPFSKRYKQGLYGAKPMVSEVGL